MAEKFGIERKSTSFAKEVFDLYKAEGRIDLSYLNKDQLHELYWYYKENLGNFSLDAQEEILEQFLLLGSISEDEAIKIVKNFNEEQKASLGEFIGKSTESGLYVRLFHDLWGFLEYGLSEKFIKRFVYDEPKNVIMVAPFVALDEYFVSEKEGEEEVVYGRHMNSYSETYKYKKTETDPSKKSFLEKYFDNFQSARKLMEVCLRHSEYVGMKSLVRYFASRRPYLFYHYIPELVEKKVISEKEVRDILVSDRAGYTYFSGVFYETEEEKNKRNMIFERAKKIFKKPKDHEDYMIVQDSEGLDAESSFADASAIKRGMDHAFQNMSKCFEYLTKEERLIFIKKMVEEGVCIFYLIPQFKLLPEEVKMFLRDPYLASEILLLPNFEDYRVMIESGMEKLALEFLLYHIREYKYDHMNRRLMYVLEDVISYFSNSSQEKIIKIINKVVPELWFYNLDYLSKFNPISFYDLVNLSFLSGDFLQHYERILNYIRVSKKKGRNIPLNEEDVFKMAREVFKRNPDLIFYNKVNHDIFTKVYDEEEKKKIIKENLTEEFNEKFLRSFLNFIDSEENNFLELFRDDLVLVLKKEPAFFWGEFIYSKWELIMKIFPDHNERFDFFMKNLEFVNLDDLLEYKESFILDIVKNRFYFDKFVKKLIEIKEISKIVMVLDRIEKMVNAHNGASSKTALDYEKKYILSRAIFERLDGVYNQFKEVIYNECLKKKFLVFESGAYELNNLDLKKIISRDLLDYISIYPESLKDLKKFIEAEQYEKTISMNMRTLVGLRDKYGSRVVDTSKLSKSLTEEISKFDPAFEIENRKFLEVDYYELVLEKISKYCFFDFYKEELQKIAKEQKKIRGSAILMEYFVPEKKFSSLLSRLNILESSNLVSLYKDKIFSLDKEKREEILGMLEILLRNNVDKSEEKIVSEDALYLLEENYEESKKVLSSLALKYVAKVFNDESILEIKDAHIEVESLRALSIYYRMSARFDKNMKLVFGNLVKKFISGNYERWRAWGDLEEDWKKYLPEKITMEQYSIWLEEFNKEFSETLSLDISDVHRGIKRVLEQAIADHHIKQGELNLNYEEIELEYEKNFAVLGQWGRELAFLQNELKEGNRSDDSLKRIKELQKNIGEYKKEKKSELNLIEGRLYLSHLKKLTSEGLEKKAIEIGGQSVAFSKIFRTLKEAFHNSEFINDILKLETLLSEANLKMFHGERVSRSKLKVSDRIDLETYLKIGESPVESCQNYNNDSGLNYGLLSYVIDPNTKIIQIYDESKKIVSRSILRLMEDKEGRPALFMERIHSANLHPKIDEAMMGLAKDKARKMGVGLYSHASEGIIESNKEEDIKTLYSRGGRSPYVYTDAGGGLKRGGVFSIEAAFLVS